MKKKQTHPPTRFQDFMTLLKPGITKMCVMMTAGGYWLARASSAEQWGRFQTVENLIGFVMVLLGAAMVVGGSCAINMVLERERDKLMARTASRPLPAGRMKPTEAWLFGGVITLVGLALLFWFANPLTAALSGFAWILYVAVYTPLKGRTSLFLLVGTVPGAIPPLLGWTAVTNQIDPVGLTLFAILVAWQLPHFIALSIMCHGDYANAGIRTLPLVRGEVIARRQAFAYSLLLLPASLLLVPLQVAGWLYGLVAVVGGLWMIWIAFRGLVPSPPSRWANRLFFASLVYLPAITLALLFDRVLGLYL